MMAIQKSKFCGGFAFDDPENDDSGVTGEAILAGRQDVVVHVPKEWTPEYVAVRLLDAYDSLRRCSVGRIYPKGDAGFWPEIYRTNEDVLGWADEHRKEVEAAMARSRGRPGSVDLARMDEALAWPAEHLRDSPLLADAVTLWAFTTALEIDVKGFLHQRKKRAQGRADVIAKETNAVRRTAARDAAVAFSKKLYVQWKVAERPPHKQREALDKIQARAEQRAVSELKRLGGLVKANPTLGMPGKVLAPSTLDRLRKDALGLMAERMRAARVPVK
jgi:hypothetical protein